MLKTTQAMMRDPMTKGGGDMAKKSAGKAQAEAEDNVSKQPGKSRASWNPSHDTRFQKGNPGGPGRPKGSKNLATIITHALSAKVPIKSNGKVRKMSKLQIMAMQLAKKATEGDLKAIEKSFALWDRYAPPDKQSEISPEQSAYELVALVHHMRMHGMLDADDEHEGEEDDAA